MGKNKNAVNEYANNKQLVSKKLTKEDGWYTFQEYREIAYNDFMKRGGQDLVDELNRLFDEMENEEKNNGNDQK